LREVRITPEALIYKELPTPTEQRERDRSKKIVEGLSPAARRFLIRVIDKCEELAQAKEAAEEKSHGTESDTVAQPSV